MLNRYWISTILCLTSCLAAEENFFHVKPHAEVPFFFSPQTSCSTITLSWSGKAHLIEQMVMFPEFSIERFFSDKRGGKIFDYLVKNDLANDLKCELKEEGNCCTISLRCFLTNNGFSKWPQVLAEIFSQLNSIINKDLPNSIKDEELAEQLMTQLKKQKIKESETSFAKRTYLQFSPSSICEVVNVLLDLPMKITLECPLEEHKYTQEIFSSKDQPIQLLLSKLPQSQFYSQYDPENRFLPRKPIQFNPSEFLLQMKIPPKKLTNSKSQTLFYLDQKCFGIPKTIWRIHVSHPFFLSENSNEFVQAQLWKYVLLQKIKIISQEALFALSRIEIQDTSQGFSIALSFWNDVNLSLNLETVLNYLKDSDLDLITWERARKTYLDDLNERGKEEQNIQLQKALLELLEKGCYSQKDKIQKAIFEITFLQFKSFLKESITSASLESLYIGRQNEEEIMSIWEDLGNVFTGIPTSKGFITPSFSKTKSISLQTEGINKALCKAIYIGESFSTFSHLISSFLQVQINSWIDKELVLDRTLKSGKVDLIERSGMLFLSITLESTVLSTNLLENRLNDIIAHGLKSLEDRSYFDEHHFDSFKKMFICHKNTYPDSLESWADQIENFAFLKQENWQFWQNTSTNTRNLNWTIAKGYIRAILFSKTPRCYLITIE